MMKKYLGWIHLRIARSLLVLAVFAGPSAAFAADYTIFLKKQGSAVPESCATGAVLGFNKPNTAGETAVQVSVVLTDQASGSPNFECLGTSAQTRLPAGTYAGSLGVVVENVTLDGQDQGLNVVGLRGTLQRSNGQGQLVFAYLAGSASGTKPVSPVRTLTIKPKNNKDDDASTGSYHIFNTNSVPEPGMLLLLSTALAALIFVKRKRKRKRSGSV